MAKILYPVGTEVQIRDWKLAELRAEGHTYDRRKRVVAAYHRGEDYPYELQGVKERFAVDEVKRYRHDDDVAKKAEGTATYSSKREAYMTRQEVQAIVAETAAYLEKVFQEKLSALHDHLVEDARIVAQDAVDEQRVDEDA